MWSKHENINAEKVKSYLFTKAYDAILDWVKIEKGSGGILALSPYTGMHNSIAPMTKFRSNKTKIEVDFQTIQDQESERRGFHLQIGKFEVSRNKRR